MPKCAELEKFAQETEDRIERTIIHPEEESDDGDEGADDVQPSDSVSEAISRTSKGRKASSIFSRSPQASNAQSSARLKLEAVREGLLARAAFLKKKQDIEMEEARKVFKGTQGTVGTRGQDSGIGCQDKVLRRLRRWSRRNESILPVAVHKWRTS